MCFLIQENKALKAKSKGDKDKTFYVNDLKKQCQSRNKWPENYEVYDIALDINWICENTLKTELNEHC